jgi:Bacterial PH domain
MAEDRFMDMPTYKWRNAKILLIAGWVAVVGFPIVLVAVVASQLVAGNGEPVAALGAMLFFAPLPIFAWLFVLRPWLSADDQGVTVRNPLSVRRLAYQDIIDVRPGYWGIAMRTQSGVVIASAVQKANASKWLHRQTRADQVAKLIQDRATGSVS